MKDEKRKKKGKYLSREAIKKMKLRQNAWRKYRQFHLEENFAEYKMIRNEVSSSLIRKDEDW